MAATLLAALLLAAAGDWTVDQPRPGVLVLRNETGAWGGASLGVSHIVKADYHARKILDLSALPAGALDRARAARLRLWLGIQDYSHSQGDRRANGLTEQFAVVLNGHEHVYRTSDPRFPSRARVTDPLVFDWVDLDVPLAELRPGANEVILRKLPGDTADDYVYPGIDNSVARGQSAASFDGGRTWSTSRLNTIDARGEYLMRLVLLEQDPAATAVWTPTGLTDPGQLLAYVGRDGAAWRFEPDREAYDRSRDLVATIQATGAAPSVAWLNPDSQPLAAEVKPTPDGLVARLPATRQEVDALRIVPPADGAVAQVRFSYQLPTTEREPVVDLAPRIAAPRGQRTAAPPTATLAGDRAVLANGALRAEFSLRPRLALRSLFVAELDRNVLADPAQCHLFRLRVGDRVWGAADSTTREVTPLADGFRLRADVGESGLAVSFTATIDPDELRLACEVSNQAAEPRDFHLSFPNLGGLALAADPATDHYLFPWYGGLIAGTPAALRSCYGDESAWWQMVDLFSPAGGGGLYLRADDPAGGYKQFALRKGETVPAGFAIDNVGYGIRPEMLWRDTLDAAPGLAVAIDHARRTRPPGGRYAPPPACLGTHAGDWREAMQRYVAWSKRTWPPRPYPSKLTACWSITASGWGQGPLFAGDRYRTDHLTPLADVDELMSWWTWSEQGPWNTPMDRLKEELGEAMYERYKSYWVKEPVSGKLMYPLNRGDYDGYMPLWGGLPALRAQLDVIRGKGLIPMFYTDGILACANTRVGREQGPRYGVMNPDWDARSGAYGTPKTPAGYVGSYGSYNMCADTEWWPEYLAETMARVCRETGVDGLRLDEYGHRGFVCSNPQHQHLFAEPGHSAWMQAVARACRLVHDRLDRVRPGLLLTTEFPGNDHVAAALEGCLVYETSAHVRPIRPVPCNLFRFYWPECKVFDLQTAARREGQAWKLWNASGVFGHYRYTAAQHALLKAHVAAFEGEREPLVPTLAPRVYANRFRGGGKTIWTVHNGTGHTFDGPVLAVRPAADQKLVDLLTGEAPAVADGAVRLRIPRDGTVVLGLVPR